jgi:hypothetical protein
MVRRLLQAIPDKSFPSTTDGKSVADNIMRFFSILRQYGSPTLRDDLERYQEMLLPFDGLTYNQFLAQLR